MCGQDGRHLLLEAFEDDVKVRVLQTFLSVVVLCAFFHLMFAR